MEVDTVNLDKMRWETDEDYKLRIMQEIEEWNENMRERIQWTDLDGAKRDFKQLTARIGMLLSLVDPDYSRRRHRERSAELTRQQAPKVVVTAPVVIDIESLATQVEVINGS